MVGYKGKAVKARDGQDGFLYVHHWDTGWQELIFKSHQDAAQFAQNNDCQYSGPN